MTYNVSVIITAPRGSGDVGPSLAALRDQLGPDDRLILLDGTRSGPSVDPAALPNVGEFKHIRNAGESAFHMRSRLSEMAGGDITILLEDHAIASPRFVSEVRRLFTADPEIVAVKVLGRNDSSNNPWSWANFLLAFAGCIHPATGVPTTLLSTSTAVRTAALANVPRNLGAWETQTMPAFNREQGRLGFSNDVWIDHVEHCGMYQAITGNFHNQRAIAAVRVAHGHRRGKLTVRAIKDLGLRRPGQIARALAGRDEYPIFAANRGKIVLICCASTLGAFMGAWFGAGDSMRKMH